MGAYLVVAHRTLVEDHLLDHVRSLCAAGPCRFHLVVPVTHPRDRAWTDGEVTAAAARRLDEGIEAFRAAGADVTGEVGDANPVYAVATALRGSPATRGPEDDEGDGAAAAAAGWAGIIVSTLPPGVSRWLGLDVVSRLKREFDLPVTHLVASSTPAGA